MRVPTILVVDDAPAIRLLCRVNLELEGHAVLEAADLAEARELLERENVDAILLDAHVGGERGADLIRELRDAEVPTPVAFLTGDTQLPESELHAADALLAKPFTLEELSATVQRLLSGPKACLR